MKKILPVAAAAALAAGTVTAAALPAQAGPIQTVFFCNGEVDDGTPLNGDLVVRAGEVCTLSNSTVTGTTTVRAGADLVVTGGELQGRVALASDGFLDAEGVAIGGELVSRNGFGVFLVGSSVAGDVRGAGDDSEVEPFFYSIDSDLAANAIFRRGDVLVESSTVGRDLSGIGTSFVDVIDSTIEGRLIVRDNELGSTFCESEVYGDASYRGNGFLLQIGSDGPITACDGASVWGANVDVSNNSADIYVDNNIVRGNFGGTGNTGAIELGENNRVRGELTGDFAPDAASAQALTVTAPEAQARTLAAEPEAADVPLERQAEVRGDAETRKAAALAEAAAVGPANIG